MDAEQTIRNFLKPEKFHILGEAGCGKSETALNLRWLYRADRQRYIS